MAWDWQVFCEDNLYREPVKGCFGKGSDLLYVGRLIVADDSLVFSKLNDGVGAVGVNTVVREHGV